MDTTSIKRDGEILFPGAVVARRYFERLVGLIGKRNLPADMALVIPKCNAIHTFFMRMPIDILFVDNQGTIVDIVPNLPPGKIIWPKPGAKHVVEMNASMCSKLGIKCGQKIQCEGVWG